ncbi:MAG TPA: acyltransferase [Solirubrobacterales bacterium]|jgi:acetyltransferase-like isoleucine patch superfamily enzyme|nr:acyltransferase [Solirubrobacterales bacterium]
MNGKLRIQYYRVTAGIRLLYLWWREKALRGTKVFIGPHCEVTTRPTAQIEIGHSVIFMHDCTIHLYGKTSIGDNCYFNRGCYLVSHEELRIGKNCIFGQRVSIHDQDHLTEPVDVAPGERGYVSSPVTIEDNVWVGAGAVILRGVNIGYGSVVAANSVVTKDIPAHSVAAGVPARVIKTLSDPGVDVSPDPTDAELLKLLSPSNERAMTLADAQSRTGVDKTLAEVEALLSTAIFDEDRRAAAMALLAAIMAV